MWTFPTSLVVSGEQIAEDLPFTDVSFTDELMGSGAFTGTLALPHRALPTQLVEAGSRLQTWCCRDGVPFGVFTWSAVRQPSLAAPVVQVSGVRSDVFAFARRPVQDDLVFAGTDAYDVVRDLYRHGQAGKTMFTTPQVGPFWWQPYGVLPWFRLGSGLSGTLVTRTRVVNGQPDNGWWRKGQKPIGDAVKAFAQELAFEVHPRYGVDPDTGELFQRMDFGAPLIGRPAGSSNAIVIEFPSPAVASGSYGWDADDLRTAAAVVGGEAQGDSPIGYFEPMAPLTAGYPYARSATSLNGVTDLVQLAAAAEAQYRTARVRESFNLTLNGEAPPRLGSYGIGDCVVLRVDQGAGLVDRELRITGWSIKVDDSRTSEQVSPTLSEVPL